MKYRYGLILWSVLALCCSACHFFEDSENVDECPLNSGYPCPCLQDMATRDCRDGIGPYCCEDGRSQCIFFPDRDETRGICSLPCTGVTDTQTCIRTEGFGSEGICSLKVDSSTTPNFCAVVCNPGGNDCPPGMECLLDTTLNYSLCIPEAGK